jgi:TolA-binding protein
MNLLRLVTIVAVYLSAACPAMADLPGVVQAAGDPTPLRAEVPQDRRNDGSIPTNPITKPDRKKVRGAGRQSGAVPEGTSQKESVLTGGLGNPDREVSFHAPRWWFIAIVVGLFAIGWYRVRYVEPGVRWDKLRDPRFLMDLLTLLCVLAFILSQINPSLLLTSTITTGGDTASHYYTLDYLRRVLLPAGLLSGWTPGNYAGFPILQFYFPLNFLLMVFMSGVVSLQVAFKLGSVAGILLLPLTAWGFMRMVRCPFPGPGIAAALTLPVLFNSSHSMWGGNILSNLAGEFSYGFSMALSLLLLGSLYHGIRENRGVIRNAILVFLVGFSHGYTLLFAEAMSLYLLVTPRGFIQRCFYLGRVYALAFCLLALWIVPLLVFTRLTTSYHLVWTINSWREIFPELLLPSLITAGLGTIGLLVAGGWLFRAAGRQFLPVLEYLWFGLTMAVVFFVAAPKIGVIDIRYVPYSHLLGSLVAALSLGWLGFSLRKWKVDWALQIMVVVATVVWVSSHPSPANSWSRWNYEGFEAKSAWPEFERINTLLRGDFQDPRVVFEHSEMHNAFGSSRAFESLPLFAGRATLEGLYMQASISAPFVFYIQSEISQQKSAPFPQYAYTSMDFDRARPHLELFNVRDLIIRSEAAKRAIRKSNAYRLRETVGQYELWELTTVNGAYVESLPFEPVAFPTSNWKQDAHRWFRTPLSLPTHLVFLGEDVSAPPEPFRLMSRDLDQVPRVPVSGDPCSVESRVAEQQIDIETDCIGRPLLIKMSYHPNWRVEGADRIWLTSPSFMLIYPKRERVRLRYGPGAWDSLGRALSLAGLLVLILNIPLPGARGRTPWRILAQKTGLHSIRLPIPALDPSAQARKRIMSITLLSFAVVVSWVSWTVYLSNPNRVFNRAIVLKDSGHYAEAREGFRAAAREMGSSDQTQTAFYYIAITYYLEQNDQAAIEAFEDLIQKFPMSSWVAESEYHIGLCFLRSGRETEGIEALRDLREGHPESRWAGYALDRLREHGAVEPQPSTGSGESADQRLGVAINHFNNDRLDPARQILTQLIEDYPDYAGVPRALAMLALTHFKTGDCEGTAHYYSTLIERFPGNELVPEALYHLAICAERAGDSAAADGYSGRLTGDFPDSIYARQVRERSGD